MRQYSMNYNLNLLTALSSATSEIVLRFTKENGEELQMKFRDYMVTQATFPVADGRGPVEVFLDYSTSYLTRMFPYNILGHSRISLKAPKEKG